MLPGSRKGLRITRSRLRSSRRRKCLVEQLEGRRMLTLNGWTNVLQPLDVLGDVHQGVTPLDALVVINELNGPEYSGVGGRLPDEPPAGVRPPHFDVNCSGAVTPLDALLVINHLNGGPKPTGWTETSSGGHAGAGFISAALCAPQLNEGNSLRTELTTSLRVPDANSAARVTFRAPVFDTTSVDTIQDALEIVVRDTTGRPIVLPYAPHLESAFNWSESTSPITGPAVQSSAMASDQVATINLTGIQAGTEIELTVRLLNNDFDTQSRVIVRGVELVPATGANPLASTWKAADTAPDTLVPWTQLQELTGSVAVKYGRTTFTSDRQALVADLALQNLGSAAARDLLLVIDQLSDLRVTPLHPDGHLADGRPYWRMQPTVNDAWLAPEGLTESRRLQFATPEGRQFTYRATVYGAVPSGSVRFDSTPVDVVRAGDGFAYRASAISSEQAAITYSLLTAPAAMSIDAVSGAVAWPTSAADVGQHSIVLRAVDALGREARQSFQVDVRTQLVNRPPVFTSEPSTDAVITSPFEVQTYKTGYGPVAVAALESRYGLSTIVTANADESRLGVLRSGANRLGPSQAVGLGELTAEESGNIFHGVDPIELGLAPSTFVQSERDIQQVLAEDVDGDGNPDAIVLANLDPSGNWNNPNERGYVLVRLGNGDGTLREGWKVQLPIVAGRVGRGASMHLADVTSDGRRDLIVVTAASSRILVYPGVPAGLFATTPLESLQQGIFATNSQVADFNQDGRLDLAVFENVHVQIGGRQGIGIYSGDGTGRFTESLFVSADTNNGGIGYVSDLDGQRGPDLVRLNYLNVRIEVYLNDGSGGVGPRIDTATNAFYSAGSPNGTGFYATSAYIDDFDGDQLPDALLGGPAGATLLRGQGNGVFGTGSATGNVVLLPNDFDEPRWYGVTPMTGRGFDLNDDGILDFAFGDTSTSNSLLIGLGRGDGHFDFTQYNTAFGADIGWDITRDSQRTPYLSIGDFNRDGVQDMLLGSSQRGEQPGSVGLLLGDQPGAFRAPRMVRNFSYSASFGPNLGAWANRLSAISTETVFKILSVSAAWHSGPGFTSPKEMETDRSVNMWPCSGESITAIRSGPWILTVMEIWISRGWTVGGLARPSVSATGPSSPCQSLRPVAGNPVSATAPCRLTISIGTAIPIWSIACKPATSTPTS